MGAAKTVRLDGRGAGGIFRIFRDEHGLSTTSMVLSLLITLSLLFTSAQVYRINSASAEVQDVADAAALAAENQVAEFMLVARFCDAIVLSLTLTGITVTGLGIAALCTPVTATASEKLLEAGKRLIDTRNSFSRRAARALNKLQEALPYFSAACAAAVSSANNADSSGASYLGVGILVPSRGERLASDRAGKAEELADDAEEKADDIREDAEEAEEAAEEANESKERAFMHDCGNSPDYCMYERASTLAGLEGPANPYFASVDTWTFSVALNRARDYYGARARQEAPADYSVAEQARSALRQHFYSYAYDKMGEGFVIEDDGGFEAYFPLLPRNTDEMRQTSLYTDSNYLITQVQDEETVSAPVMHAYSTCPGAVGLSLGYGSISYMESGGFQTCPECGFTAASMGRVASASTSISNGFEYHYRIVAQEAQAYEQARKEADRKKREVRNETKPLFEQLTEALKESAEKRIEPKPPGRYGAVAFVVNVGTTSPAGGFASSFVRTAGSLGPRAAISASTLLDQGSDEGRTAINSALDGLRENGGIFVGAAGIVLDLWSWMLTTYSDGQEAVEKGVRDGLDSLPLVGASGLGTWAAKKLKKAVEAVGLQPAEVGALKPVLVNSAHVAAKGESSFSTRLLSIKQGVLAHPQPAADLFSAVMNDAERTALAQVSGIGDSVEIASIELLGSGGPSIPITIPIPDSVKGAGEAAIQGLFARIRSQHAQTMEVRAWE